MSRAYLRPGDPGYLQVTMAELQSAADAMNAEIAADWRGESTHPCGSLRRIKSSGLLSIVILIRLWVHVAVARTNGMIARMRSES